MSSPPVTVSVSVAVLSQLDATIQLIETSSSSLSSRELLDARQVLTRAYDSMGRVLDQRDDVVTFICKFGGHSLILY